MANPLTYEQRVKEIRTCPACGQETLRFPNNEPAYCTFCEWSEEDEVVGSEKDEEPAESKGQMHEANDDAMERWARRYDEFNGGPENEEDR